MCGFSEPLLRLYPGPEFSGFGPLLFLMAAHLCINVAVLPLLGLQLAANRVKTLALVTIVMGLANLGLALLLAGPAGWGLYGIAAAGAIMLTAKNVCFTPPTQRNPWQTMVQFLARIGVDRSRDRRNFSLCRTILRFRPVDGWIELCAMGL